MLERLVEAGESVRLLATHESAAERLRNDSGPWNPPVHVMPTPVTKPRMQRASWQAWKLAALARQGHQQGRCSDYREARRRERSRTFAHRAVAGFGRRLPEASLESLQCRLLERVLGGQVGASEDWLEATRPRALLLGVGTLTTSRGASLLRVARRLGCPVFAIDAAWDDLYCTYPHPRVDGLMVWSQAMKQEAVEWHGYPPERVHVVGSLRCDAYRTGRVATSRETLLRQLGFSPEDHLVTLATNVGDEGTYLSTVRALVEASEAGRFGRRLGVLVRPHPRMELSARDALRELPNVAVEDGFDFAGARAVPQGAIDRLAAVLGHSDVVLSVLSTLMLESAYYDTPNISLRFGGLERFYRRQFLRPILASGAFEIAGSPVVLIEQLAAYLQDPARDRAARARFRDTFGGPPQVSTAARTLEALRSALAAPQV